MAPGFYIWRSPCNNPLADLTGDQDKLAGPQGSARRSDAGSHEALILPKAPILSLIFSIKDFFTRFMKTFVESIQARDREQTNPRKQPFKTRSPETYSRKSHINCYHFHQQFEDNVKISGSTRKNYTLFTALFFHGTINLKWAQHKRRHQSATLIIWLKFKTFL